MATTDERRTGWARSTARISETSSRLRFRRSREDVLLAGVSGGLAARLGVDPILVRIAFVLLTFAGMVGFALYLIAWMLSDEPDASPEAVATPDPQRGLAFGAIVLGVLLVLRDIGLWFGDSFGIPLLIVSAGAAVLYVSSPAEQRAGFLRVFGGSPSAITTRPPLIRVAIGGLLVVGGATWFLLINRSLEGIFAVLLAVGVTSAGLAVVFGPWLNRLVNQLSEERRDRIRSEERADLAAHLHDSVLQTLALIQRASDDPRKMSTLARRQERELRTWLYGDMASTDASHLEAAIQTLVSSIEEARDVVVEAVVVGDCVLDDATRAVVDACREAAHNAAKHSGVSDIAIYIECEPDELNAYVRDRGQGFDPDTVLADRRGIADSIHRRIERHGGRAVITSTPGDGCEVQITMPRSAA